MLLGAISGLGGGGILTLVMIVVSDVVTLKERGKYQGILGGVVACANSVGPVLGGVFTEKASCKSLQKRNSASMAH
jgi:MFS family permease